MKLIKLLVFIIVGLFLSSCAISSAFSNPNKAKLLYREFKRWQEFQMEGIAELQYKEFSIRKSFVFSKNREALRFDVLDGGLFGLSGGTLSIYADSTGLLDAIVMNQELSMDNPQSINQLFKYLNSIELSDIEPLLKDIDSKNEFTKDKVKFVFNNQMRLIQISSEDLGLRVDISYTFSNEIKEISIYLSNLKICNLRIDKITYDNISVSKLK
jgi:Asp-tRNA(Asn)/Glu-tRNA(Gln) amidotransferase C subunit